MSQKPNTDAEDILSELENSEKDLPKEPTPEPEPEPTPEPEPEPTPEPEPEPEPTPTEEPIHQKSQNVVEERKTRDVILIGKKPIITYVNSTLTQLSSLPLVTITARGKSITNAVDVSQFILKRMNSVGYEISDVRISSDLLVSNDGKKRNVSSIEIDIKRIQS